MRNGSLARHRRALRKQDTAAADCCRPAVRSSSSQTAGRVSARAAPATCRRSPNSLIVNNNCAATEEFAPLEYALLPILCGGFHPMKHSPPLLLSGPAELCECPDQLASDLASCPE